MYFITMTNKCCMIYYRVTMQMGHARDFLTVGSMGHASAIALGIALQKPKRQVGDNELDNKHNFIG